MKWFKLTKKGILIIGLTLGVITGILLIGFQQVNAEKQYSYPQTSPKADTLTNTTSLEDTTNAQPPSEIKSDENKSDKILTELSATAQNYLHKGWLHFIQRLSSDTDLGSRGMLENGNVVSAQSYMECWLNLEEDLIINDSVCIQTNLNGTIIQVGVHSGEKSWNSATDQVITSKDLMSSYIADIDALTRRIDKINTTVTINEVTSEYDKKLVQFSYNYKENSPVQLGDYNQLVTMWQYKYTFDTETGMMVSFQQWVTLEDGNQRLLEQVEHQVFEFVEKVPSEVEQYLRSLENK